MFENYIIKLNKYNGNEIGYISFNINKKSIYIQSLYITDINEKNKGYGSLLLLLMLKYVIKNINDSYYIKKIYLDDCSDLALTKKSIYYKFGFRITNKQSCEIMQVNFLKPYPSKYLINKYYIYHRNKKPSIKHFNSIIDFYLRNIIVLYYFNKKINKNDNKTNKNILGLKNEITQWQRY
jgi:hypothetical protein